MEACNTRCWFSYHVFTESDRNWVLTHLVQELVRQLTEQKLIDRFFFMRYNEGGKHLRLRFRGFVSTEQVIDTKIQEFFTIDTFQVKKEVYQPEMLRYGGIKALPIAEQHFQLSSEVCMAVLNEKSDEMLTRGAILHFAMAKASGKTSSELIQLFTSYTQNWFSYSGLSGKQTDREELIHTYFEPQYNGMRRSNFFRDLSEIFSSNNSTGISWLDQWFKGNQHLLADLNRVMTDDIYFSVMESLIHMTNNRLGIKNFDEAFVAYLLKRILEDEYEA